MAQKTNWAAVGAVAAAVSALVALLAYVGSRHPSTPSSLPAPANSQVSPSYASPPLTEYTPPTIEYTPPIIEYTPPTTEDPPPAMHFGAIAVSNDGSRGRAWGAVSAAAARQQALDSCPRSYCTVIVQFVNSCGAVAYNPYTGRYWGGQGATATEAENNAVSNAGAGRWIVYQCSGAQ